MLKILIAPKMAAGSTADPHRLSRIIGLREQCPSIAREPPGVFREYLRALR
jgi:hypothetical protein